MSFYYLFVCILEFHNHVFIIFVDFKKAIITTFQSYLDYRMHAKIIMNRSSQPHGKITC